MVLFKQTRARVYENVAIKTAPYGISSNNYRR